MDVTIACPCPPKADGEPRHDQDTVTLRDTLDFRTATAIRNTIALAKADDEDAGTPEIMALLTEAYILHGITAWTLVDDKGKALPVSKTGIRSKLLADGLTAEPVAEAADTLYAPVILFPLVRRALASSQPSPTDESTFPPTALPRKNQKRSKPSSTSISGTAGTATITSLHGGGSNSSPSSASVA